MSDVPVYGWGKWPEHLLTKKQMSDAGFQTGKNLPPPAGMVRRAKSPDGYMYLYDRSQGVPKKPISDEARAKLKAAAEKAREGWYCVRCGQPHRYSTKRGWKSAYFWPPALCDRCDDHDNAVAWARDLLAGEFLILDTETTGLTAGHDEIVQIAVINQAGKTLLNTLVLPQHPGRLMESSAMDVHGITPESLLGAPGWPEVYAKLIEIVAGKKVVIYNAAFDEAMIAGDCKRHGITPVELDADCAMEMYAQWYGEWSSYWGSYKWQPLDGGHTALSDCRACLGVIREMAKQETKEETES